MKKIITTIFTLPTDHRVFGLDFLRAIAILMVLLTHSSMIYPFVRYKNWFSTVSGLAGHLGVELFFVLSGFLIGSILLSLEPKFQKTHTLLEFWQRRWFRTIPNYLFFLFIYVVFTRLLVSKPIPNILSYITFTQNWLWPHPTFFGQAWSLAVEEWFYLLFPISLFILYQLTKSFNSAFLISAGIFIIIPSIIRINWALLGIDGWGENFRKVMFLRLDAIMYGVLAAWVKSRYLTIWKNQRFLFLITGITILLISLNITFKQNPNTIFFAKTFFFSFVSLSFAFILPACDQWNGTVKNPLTTSISLIALWSYSLYLCNSLVAGVLSDVTDYFGRSYQLINIGIFLSFFAISIVVSSILYTFLEKPAMNFRDLPSKIK